MKAKRVSTKGFSNVFKVFGAVSLAGLLSMASLQADEAQSTKDMQAEIDALEKENQLLELKQKNEKLKAGQSDTKDSAKAESKNAVVDKSGAFGFCKGQHASTGCFIGASVGLAFGENYIPSIRPDASSDYIPSQEKSFTAFPVNIDLGWQWYYAQNAGFRFKGYVGYGYYGTKFDNFTMGGETGNFDATIHAIQYGLEASYLYDFVYKGNHNFGAHVSVGFEGSTFVGQSVDLVGGGATESPTIPSYSKFTWTSGIGIHYFYKVHHQFFLSYLYRGYTNDKTIGNNSFGEYGTDGRYNERLAADFFRISTTPKSTIMLSYAYKF